MSVALYRDENVHDSITRVLRRRGVDVLTAQEDGMRRKPDPEVLDRATALSRVAVSEDADFLTEATRRQREGVGFAGVIRVPQSLALGRCVDDLEIIAKATTPQDHIDTVTYLPL